MPKPNLVPLPDPEHNAIRDALLETMADLASGNLSSLILCATNTSGQCNSVIIGEAKVIEFMFQMALDHINGKVQEDGTVIDGEAN